MTHHVCCVRRTAGEVHHASHTSGGISAEDFNGAAHAVLRAADANGIVDVLAHGQCATHIENVKVARGGARCRCRGRGRGRGRLHR